MPYSLKNPPDWLKGLPKGAIRLGVDVFNAVYAKDKDDDKARQAAWAAIKNKYEKTEAGTWRAKQDVSLHDIERMLQEALEARGKDAWLRDVYGSYIIYEQNGKYYRLPYSLLDGKVQFASEATEVEQVWAEARSRQAADGDEMDDGIEILLRLDEAQDPEGAVWEVTICEPGPTKNGWLIPDDALRAAAEAGLFEGVDVNLYELPQGATHVPDALFDIKSLLTKNKVGWIDNVKHVAGRGLQGVLHFLDSAKWLGRNLLKAAKDGGKAYGLSYDAPVRAKKSEHQGRPVIELIKFLAADSVDIVTRPAAGGKFQRAIAAHRPKEVVMGKEEIWKLIQETRPDLLKGKDLESITDEEIAGLARMAMEAPQKPDNRRQTTDDPQAADVVTELKALRCEMALGKALAGDVLPDMGKARVRKMFEGRIFEPDELQRAIADEKDFWADLETAKKKDDDEPIAGGRVHVGIGTLERAQMAVDRTFGLTREQVLDMAAYQTLEHEPFFEDMRMRSRQDYEGFDDVPAFSGIREMYTFFTGDTRVTGQFNRKRLPPDLRAKADITSTTFSYVLGNTMGRRLVSDYRSYDYLEGLLISIRKPVRDFRQQEAVLVGGFPDLDTVDPETADYDEIAGVTDEESTYTIGQKGNILMISRKTIINDDISLVLRLLRGLARAARRTHGKYVWNKFINNDTCSDGTAWFTSGHGNLGSTAFSHAQGLVAYKALAKMTEKDSGERLGLLADRTVKPNIVGPIDIMETLRQVEEEEYYYTSDDLTTKTPNPLKGLVKSHAHPLLTDANDWGMLLPPDVIDIIEMGYLNGRQEPEMFVADSPQSEQVFVADKIRHKIRHEYAGAVIDYRSGYKGVVA